MSLIEDWERAGIQDFFTVNMEANGLLAAVCKSITKVNVGEKDENGELKFHNCFKQ